MANEKIVTADLLNTNNQNVKTYIDSFFTDGKAKNSKLLDGKSASDFEKHGALNITSSTTAKYINDSTSDTGIEVPLISVSQMDYIFKSINTGTNLRLIWQGIYITVEYCDGVDLVLQTNSHTIRYIMSSGAITPYIDLVDTIIDNSDYAPSSATIKTSLDSIKTSLDSKLDKLSYEWNKSIPFGSTGYLKIGSFPMYDTNITIDIDSTTLTTYHATVIIATQNTSETTMGSCHKVEVHDDASNTITPNIVTVWTSGSRNYDVYFQPASWSKNLVHIRAVGIYHNATVDETQICIAKDGTIPTTTSGLEAVNIFRANIPSYTLDGSTLVINV